ncbi:MAG: helix-turn-helix transcriptional regulator [Oscillospiraceae bacterium]|nr:helix-turn-helix transcriptional regulator [Oscillospiraceae bacterium]
MSFDEIEKKIQDGKDFIRNRITELRLKANVSEYQMSFELGQSKSYVQSISSGKAMPSMAGFLNICDYFGITPLEFFDTTIEEPNLLNDVINSIKTLSESDLELILEIAQRLKSGSDD